MNRNLPYTDSDVRPHIDGYVRRTYPVRGTRWNYEWYYRNGEATVSIDLTINGETEKHLVSVKSIVGNT